VTESEIPRDLGNGLWLRRSTAADADALADFNARIHSDFGFDQPDEAMAAWTRDLLQRPHPTFAPGDFTLVEDTRGQRIVSTCNLISQTWTYSGIPFAVGQPELVGTLPEFRRRGLIRAQMEIIHQWSAERGQVVQGITGIPNYYRQFGYEMALPLQGGRSAFEPNIPPLAPGAAEPYRLRAASLDDIPFLMRVYDYGATRERVACVRDAAQWQYEITGQSSASLNRRVLWIIQSATGESVGFLAHFPTLGRGGWLAATAFELKPGVSWLAVCPSVLRALWAEGLATATRQGSRLLNLTLLLGGEHPAYAACADRLPRGWPPYAWYLRVPDLPGFVRRVAPALEARLAASIAPGHTGELKLSFYRDGLRLVLAQGRLAAVEAWQPPVIDSGDAEFPGLTFLQLLFGYRSLAELMHAFPDCRCPGDEARALLNAMFPKQASNVWHIS
jgi:GNAT superfamily N-acetyltransferase